MPRRARQLSKTGIYHVMLRGNERRDIFLDDADKIAFIDYLYAKKTDEDCSLYAYCLMDNHVHLVVKEGANGISKLMKRIGTSYVRYFNQKYKRIGHLFQDRYKSENVETDSYFLTVIRYVHQNPEKAGISKPQDYSWSSYQKYLAGPGKSRYLPEMTEVLGLFAQDIDESIERFRQFHMEYCNEVCLDVDNDAKFELHIREFMQSTLENTGLSTRDLAKPENVHILRDIILKLKGDTGLSGRKLSQLTGINREVIRKALLAFN